MNNLNFLPSDISLRKSYQYIFLKLNLHNNIDMDGYSIVYSMVTYVTFFRYYAGYNIIYYIVQESKILYVIHLSKLESV